MSRESVAEMALNKAERELEQKLSQLSAEELEKVRLGWNDFSVGLSQHYDKFANTGKGAGYIFVVTSLGNILIDSSKGESGIKQALGLLGDGVVALAAFALRMTPYGGAVSIGNAVLGHFGIDLSSDLKWLYDLVFKDDEISIQNGYLRIEKTDGTVYMRPVKSQKIKSIYNITDESHGAVTGENKNDVLFGGNGNDMLIGHGGSDILIGGAGKDDYFIDNGDTIKDSDGKGRVFLSSTNIQLTGGTQIEKGSKIYKGKDGVKYEISGYNLIINDNITIENFSNDNLEIHLSEFDEINVSISGATVVEKDQSMKFIVSLNKEPEVGKFVKVSVGKKTYKFMNFSETNYTIDEGVENVFGAQAEYEYVWNDDTVKEEDEKFKVTANIVDKSDGLKASVIKNGNGTIIDDDPEDVDPIIIDLNKNGITSTKLNNTIYFDHDNNNFKEASSWIDKGDAFLALDKNSNGLIDNGNELFGNHTISNTRFKYTNNKATNGYEALKAYDLNGDNVIDSKDEIYDKLLLWKDSNQNAITDKGELIKLKDSGIVSIDLNYKNTSIDEKGNTIKQSSTVTFEDGSTTIANDVWFKVNLDKTKHISIDEMIKDTLINLNKRQDELIKEYKENNNLNTNDLNDDEPLQNILNSDEILKTYNDKLNTLFYIKSLLQVKAFGNLSSLQEAMVNNPKLATMMNLY